MDIPLSFLVVLLLKSSFFSAVQSTEITIVNQCRSTIWPGILTNGRGTQLTPSGFILGSNESRTLSVPKSWTGSIWGRTDCSTDNSTGKFSCVTGDCGSGKVECAGGNGSTLATLAEIAINTNLDFYDVSLVYGFNLPMLLEAKGGKSGGCSSANCLSDLNASCPRELRVQHLNGSGTEETVACMSACYAFNTPVHCCKNGTANCQPTLYSSFFKDACPLAYSYAQDDRTSTFTCSSANYSVIFCPPAKTGIIQSCSCSCSWNCCS